MTLPHDSWQLIMKSMPSIGDILSTRLVEREANSAFYNTIEAADISDTYPQCTFLKNSCMTCGSGSDIRTICYFHDKHPMRHIYYCVSPVCFFKSFEALQKDLEKDRVYPFVKHNKNNTVNVPRSSGGYSRG